MSYIEATIDLPQPITGRIVGYITEHYNRRLEVEFEYHALACEWAEYLKHAKRSNGHVLVTLSLIPKEHR